MFKNIEKLEIMDIQHGETKKNGFVECRKSNSVILRISGRVFYEFQGTSFYMNPGEVIFLPKGSTYSYARACTEPCEFVAIRFEGEITNPRPSVCSAEHFPDVDDFMYNLADFWRLGQRAEHYKCYAVFYNLLSYMETMENLDYSDKKKLGLILPGVEHLKHHIYDCNLKIEDLHTLCGISDTYFRKLFCSNYAMSPAQYIVSKRLSRAKTIIDSGDFDTISEIAAMVGYNDALYFSRAFKKKYGMSPSLYAKS